MICSLRHTRRRTRRSSKVSPNHPHPTSSPMYDRANHAPTYRSSNGRQRPRRRRRGEHRPRRLGRGDRRRDGRPRELAAPARRGAPHPPAHPADVPARAAARAAADGDERRADEYLQGGGAREPEVAGGAPGACGRGCAGGAGYAVWAAGGWGVRGGGRAEGAVCC